MSGAGAMPVAAAYWHMSSMVGKDYFLKPHPEVGVHLAVKGSDGVLTRWWVGAKQAGKITRAIRARRLPLVVLESQPYDDRRPPT